MKRAFDKFYELEKSFTILKSVFLSHTKIRNFVFKFNQLVSDLIIKEDAKKTQFESFINLKLSTMNE